MSCHAPELHARAFRPAAGRPCRAVAAGGALLLLVLLLVLLLGWTSGCTREGSEKDGAKVFERLLAESAELEEAGQEARARAVLEKALESLEPGDRARAQARIAALSLEIGQDERALAAAGQALALGFRSPGTLWARGEALRRMMDHVPARAALREALALDPDHRRALLSLARLEFRLEDPKESLAHFEAYLRSAPEGDLDTPTARLEYGRALRAAGRPQEAADQFALLLEEDPTESAYYSELAATLYRMRLRRPAKFLEGIYRAQSQGSFEEYGARKLKAQGRDAFALSQEALNAARRKRFLRAFELHRQALAASTGDARIAMFHSSFSLAFLRRREALEVAERALARGFTPRSGLWWEKGRAQAEREDWEAAARSFETALEELEREERAGDRRGVERGQADRFQTAIALVRSHLELGRFGPARSLAERLRKAAPDAWEPHYWEGRIALEAGETPAALARFDAALARVRDRNEPPSDLALYRAVALGRSGRAREALEVLVAGLENAPGRIELCAPARELARGEPAVLERLAALESEAAAARERADALARELDSKPLEESARFYLELARAYRKLREPAAHDFLLLASDLAPRDVEILHEVLDFIQRPQDVFVRLVFLRRLLEADPDDPRALGSIADIYLELHVRLDEAAAFAERFHAVSPGEASFRLLAKAALVRGRREEAVEILRRGLAAFPASDGLRELFAAARGEE